MDLAWTCRCCRKQFDTLSFAYSCPEPDAWRALPEDERSDRGTIWTDTCVIDQSQFFIRGRILLPVIGQTAPFIWGLWARISQESFVRFGQFWDVEKRDHEPPFPAGIANHVPVYPATLDLKCSVRMQNARRRPSFVLESPDHPLANEQRNGITLDRVKELASLLGQHRG